MNEIYSTFMGDAEVKQIDFEYFNSNLQTCYDHLMGVLRMCFPNMRVNVCLLMINCRVYLCSNVFQVYMSSLLEHF